MARLGFHIPSSIMIWRTLSRESLSLMHFHQLLVRQRRPKIRVLLFDQIQGLLCNTCIQLVVARFAAPLAHQPFGALSFDRLATAV